MTCSSSSAGCCRSSRCSTRRGASGSARCARLRRDRQPTLGSSGAQEDAGFSLTQEEVLVAGGMMIAGVVLTLAGNLLV